MNNPILEYIVQRLQSYGAQQMAFVAYEAVSTTIEVNEAEIFKIPKKWLLASPTLNKPPNYTPKLHSAHQLTWRRIDEAHSAFTQYQDDLAEPDKWEIGIVSAFNLYDGVPLNPRKCPHLLFADCDVSDVREVEYDLPNWKIAQTAKGFHAYSGKYVDTLNEMLEIVTKAKCVDPKWINCCNKQGFAVLRLTGNTKAAPCFV